MPSLRQNRVLGKHTWLLPLVILGLFACKLPPKQIPYPATRAELSNYLETSRYRDVIDFLRVLSGQSSSIRVEDFGESAQGRKMPLAILSNRGCFTPELAHQSGLPIVLIINCIHAGEVEGKEASLMLAREILLGQLNHLLDHMVLLIVPLFNPDGNELINPQNRRLDLAKLEGQMGPEGGVGTRQTAEGINLNRDYIKQEAVEMRNLTRGVYLKWWPHLTIDCHTTDGSIHGYDLTFDHPHNPASGHPGPIEYVRRKLLPEVSSNLESRTGIKSFFYGNFIEEKDPSKGWKTYPHLPRYGSHYRGLTNRMDILLETYSYLPFRVRCRVSYEFLYEVLGYVARHGEEIVKVVEDAQRDTIQRGQDPRPNDRVGIRYKCTPYEEHVWVLVPQKQIGPELAKARLEALKGKFVPLKMPHWAKFIPTKSVPRPWGYAIPSSSKHIIRMLKLHGIKLWQVDQRPAVGEVTIFRIKKILAKRCVDTSLEERDEYLVDVTQEDALSSLDGAVIAKTAQPLGNLLIYLLEPESDDGLLTWFLPRYNLKEGELYPVMRVPKDPGLALEALQ
jgi:hypothetical protein